ncbi:uncharacterized protein Bfra_003904 [Botrytis fragariae]|uniref:Uncharacterized protein n=1 Tax=Botrytis fragariae TaxID=1964551 RepID=A0A8H6AXV5_9HELO|nr:uncharacterized protein Bfra_003904 [Botrytis fragariae]KAF5875450.1 hypothetical protein Bfra_003904 [Botrytis fragariae]
MEMLDPLMVLLGSLMTDYVVFGSDQNPVTFCRKQTSESCLTHVLFWIFMGRKLSESESCPHYLLVLGTSDCDLSIPR